MKRCPGVPFGLVATGLAALLSLMAGPLPGQAPAVGGTLVVVNKGASTASIVDVTSGEIVATVPTGTGPHEVAISADGRTAVITNYGARAGGNTLTVIDVPDRAVARTIDLGEHRRPHGIAFLPGDEVVAVTTEESGHVVIVNLGSGEIVQALPTEGNVSHMLAVPGAADRIYTSDIRDGTVTEILIDRGKPARKIDVPVTPEAVGVRPDGSEVWVGSNELGVVSVIDTGTGEVAQVLNGFGWPYRVHFSADGSLALIPDLRGDELRIVDAESRKELAIFSFPGGGPQGVTFSADGRYAFQSLSRQGRVAVIDLGSMSVVGYLSAGSSPDGVAHTPLQAEQE